MIKRVAVFITALSLLLTIAAIFCGCDGGEEPAAATTDAQTDAPLPVSLSDYTIIRPDRDTLNEKDSAVRLHKYLKEQCGTETKIGLDRYDHAADKYEIIVGHTTTEETARSLEALSAREFSITFSENKIVIVGVTAWRTSIAVDYFIENYLSAGSDSLTSTADYTDEYNPQFEQTPIKVISLNLRTAKSATQNTQGEREPLIADFVATTLPDSIGTQECEDFWRNRLDIVLTGYTRAQRITQVTKNYIWYNPQTLTCVDAGVFWLSETPEESSKGFGSSYYISCCWAIFEVKATGARYVHMNTHLDVNSQETRKAEIEVLLERANAFVAQDYPVIITGDFNAREDSVIYSSMTSGHFADLKYQTTDDTTMGTFNGFVDDGEYSGPIDFCFGNDLVTGEKYTVYDKWNGKFMSDHNGLLFELTLYKR